jgi:hypothetical protein
MLHASRIVSRGNVHAVDPHLETVRVVQCVKNFAAIKGVSHIGLGVTALNNMRVLRRAGVRCDVWSIQTAAELQARLASERRRWERTGDVPISHIVVSAPWITPEQFRWFCGTYPDVEFVLENHSGCAFLSIDHRGVRNIRGSLDLQTCTHNMKVAANNTRVCDWLTNAYKAPCLYLPNLYDTTSFVPYTPKPIGDTLRLGSFGATRALKNQFVAAQAAVQLGRHLGLQVELYVNAGRTDGGERTVESRREMFDQLPGSKLVEVTWQPWPRFRRTCAQMHLLLQPSFSETFNVVTADGIAEGVPSVTSECIEWTPRRWQAATDDPHDLVKVAIYLLNDPRAVEDGRRMLADYVAAGTRRWLDYLLHH